MAKQQPAQATEPNELLDPVRSIINDREIGQDDAAYLASFVDSEKIVKTLKEAGYTVEKKLQYLAGVFTNEKSSVGEGMRAMKMIDDMIDASLGAQGIMMNPNQVNGVVMPIGQAQALHSVTMTEKSVKMTVEAASQLEEVQAEIQPLKEQDDGKEKDPDQDAFFEDDRSGNDNILREARVD